MVRIKAKSTARCKRSLRFNNRICLNRSERGATKPAGKTTSQVPVVNENRLPPHAVLAEILWELTFFGWTEAENQKKMTELEKTLAARMKKKDASPIG